MFTATIQYPLNYDEDEIADQGSTFTQEQVVAEKPFYKSLLDCSDVTRRRRISKILNFLEAQAARNRVTLNELLGLITKQANYITDRRSSKIGLELQTGRSKTELTLAQCSYLVLYLKLERNGYERLKKVITSQNNYIIFQTWKNVRIFQNSRAPAILDSPHQTGVKFDFVQALELSAKQLLEIHADESTKLKLTMCIKDGVDGSGSHAIYHQQSNEQTQNMIMYMFCVMRLCEQGPDGRTLYQEDKCGSPHALRPLFYVMGKENRKNLKDVQDAVRQRQQCEALKVKVNGRVYEITLDARLSMIDAKMRSLLTGLGGAYCLLCTAKRTTGWGMVEKSLLEGTALKDVIESECFHINRDYETTKADYSRLFDHETQKIKKRKGDEADRKGVTQEPLIDGNLNDISPVHALMNTFKWLQKLAYFLNAESYIWTESAIELGSHTKQIYDKCVDDCKILIRQKTGIRMDTADPSGKGGNTDKGDVCKRLMTSERHHFCELVPQRFRLKFNELVTRLWVCISLYTGKDEVHVKKYKDFCLDTYMLILSNFNNDRDNKWIQIRPTVHSLLAHSWELIKENDAKGLGEYTEGPLENNNKFFRFNRQFLARKFSQKTNMTDCLTRGWNISDPLAQSIEPRKLCSRCGETGHFTVSCPLKGYDEKDTAETLQSWFMHQLLV